MRARFRPEHAKASHDDAPHDLDRWQAFHKGAAHGMHFVDRDVLRDDDLVDGRGHAEQAGRGNG